MMIIIGEVIKDADLGMRRRLEKDERESIFISMIRIFYPKTANNRMKDDQWKEMKKRAQKGPQTMLSDADAVNYHDVLMIYSFHESVRKLWSLLMDIIAVNVVSRDLIASSLPG